MKHCLLSVVGLFGLTGAICSFDSSDQYPAGCMDPGSVDYSGLISTKLTQVEGACAVYDNGAIADIVACE